MGFRRNLRQLILRFDLFSTNASLRVRGQPDYKSVQCGLFSLLLIGLFMAFFFQAVLNVLHKSEITASSILKESPNSTEQIEKINFAVSIENTDIGELPSHFDFVLEIINHTKVGNSYTKVYLERCTESSWGADTKKYYNELNMNDMFCVPSGVDLKLIDNEAQDIWQKIEMRIERCSGSASPCSSEKDFNVFIQTHLNTHDYFNVRLHFLDVIFSPVEEVPALQTVNMKMFLSFTDTLGCRAEITLGEYQINTDESIWPYVNNVEEKGSYITGFQVSTTGLRSNKFARIGLYKSKIVYQIYRSYGKVDDLLSYIGGLFSLILSFLFFFFGSFNEYRYELMVAENTFTYDGEAGKPGSKEVEQRDMGVLGYFKYQLFDWLLTLGINLNWKEMRKMHEIREEVTHQLDIRYVVKKMRYYDRILSMVLDEPLQVCTKIMKPIKLSEAKKDRKIIEYYGKLMNDPHNNKHKIGERLKLIKTLMIKKKSPSSPNIQSSKVSPKGSYVAEARKTSVLMSIKQMRNVEKKNLQKGQYPYNNSSNYLESIKKNRNIDRMDRSASKHNLNGIDSSDLSIINNYPLDLEKQKNESSCCKKCCEDQNCLTTVENLLDDPLDSDDEQAEQTVYRMYRRLGELNPQQAKKVLVEIPQELKLKINTFSDMSSLNCSIKKSVPQVKYRQKLKLEDFEE